MGTVSDKDFTTEQLEERLKGLNEVVKILKEENIPYRLAAGTLLGFYRDNSFISWDNDVDIFFNVKDIYYKTDKLIKVLSQRNFKVNHIEKEYKCFSFKANK